MSAQTFQVTQGTQTQLSNDLVGTTVYPISKIDVGAAGASVPFTGTFLGGTINAGTVTSQINAVPFVVGTSYGTQGTTGAAVWGTLVASSGAGTKQYVSGVDISGVSGTCEVVVTNIGVGGSLGNGVLARFNTVPGGGISKVFNPVQASGTGGTLAFWMSTSGTVDITIQYWNGV